MNLFLTLSGRLRPCNIRCDSIKVAPVGDKLGGQNQYIRCMIHSKNQIDTPIAGLLIKLSIYANDSTSTEVKGQIVRLFGE